MFDGEAFGKQMVDIVKGYVLKALAPIAKRLEAVEQREAISADVVREMIAAAIGALPPAEPMPEQWRPDADEIRSLLQPLVDALPKPADGKSVSMDDLAPIITEKVSEAVSEAVKSIPMPKDGKDGRDGLDAVTPLIKDGTLLFTMSDGSVKEVGKVAGEDGRDGENGADGVDGLGFDDLAAEYDGERGIVLRFTRGDRVKEFVFTMPVVIDRGVWVEGKGYSAGDAVTWAGSVWIAQKDTADKPDGGDGWRLSVKRGRDGKPGRDGELKVHQPVRVG